jgi:signal peptidase I
LRRRPFVAGFLSLWVIGLGDAYNGFPGRGAALLATAFGTNIVLAVVWSSVSAAGIERGLGVLLLLLVGVPLALRIYAAIRAWRDARRLHDAGPERPVLNRFVAYLGLALLAGLVVTLGVRTFVLQAFTVPSASMEPTLLVGDHILVNKLAAELREPRVGDIVVFHSPKDPANIYMKRVVAVRGETIYIHEKRVYIDGQPRDDSHARFIRGRKGASDEFGPFSVPSGRVFVLGDDRDESYDSRSFGAVPVAEITGRAAMVYWSWDRARHRVRWNRVAHPIH